MKKYAIIDDSNLPALQINFTGHQPCPENFRVYLEDLTKAYENKPGFVAVFDAQNAPYPDLTCQKMMADWLKKNKEMIAEKCLGTAYIMEDEKLKAVLDVVLSMQSQPVPYRIFSNLQEAKIWTEHLIAKNQNKKTRFGAGLSILF